MTDYEPRVYRHEDFEHGLTCPSCGVHFYEGMEICEYPDSFIGDTIVVMLLCSPCAKGMKTGFMDGLRNA